jgi:hypothetical protein
LTPGIGDDVLQEGRIQVLRGYFMSAGLRRWLAASQRSKDESEIELRNAGTLID